MSKATTFILSPTALVAACFFLSYFLTPVVFADSLVVNTLADDTTPDNDLFSLREAVAGANDSAGPDNVHFTPGLNGAIALTEGEIAVTDDVEIDGPGHHVLTVSGNDSSRIFNISVGTSMHISGLKIRNGLADGSSPDYGSVGGGILNQGNLSLWHVVMTDNQAVGDPDVDVQINEALLIAGAPGGGAIGNFGQLSAHHCGFHHNQSLGADETIRAIPGFPTEPIASGAAQGGAIYCGTAGEIGERPNTTLSHCHFSENLVRGGNDCVGDFAGVSLGGAISNAGELTVEFCSFSRNRSEGGSRTLAPFNNGQGDGGAISCGGLRPLVVPTDPGSSLTARHCTFYDNLCRGGDENVVVLPPDQVPRAAGPDNAHGGAIVAWQGTANIRSCYLAHNVAVGGDGGAEFNGSLGIGGGIFIFGYLGEVTGELKHVTFFRNNAIGGSGVNDSAGGAGIGGGLTIGAFDAPFAIGMDVDVKRSLFLSNSATGGDGSSGGNAEGGGIANGVGGNSTLSRNVVFFNWAIRGDGNPDGTGFGGGIFNAGMLDIDAITQLLTRHNHADEGDNIYQE